MTASPIQPSRSARARSIPAATEPGIERARDELEGWMRQAVITCENADALWAWVRSASGDSDLLAWTRLLAELAYTDTRRSLAVARIRTLRRDFGL